MYMTIIFTESVLPIKAKLYVERSWEEGGTLIHDHDQDGCRVWTKPLKNVRYGTRISMVVKLGKDHRGLKGLQRFY